MLKIKEFLGWFRIDNKDFKLISVSHGTINGENHRHYFITILQFGYRVRFGPQLFLHTMTSFCQFLEMGRLHVYHGAYDVDHFRAIGSTHPHVHLDEVFVVLTYRATYSLFL